MGRAGRGRYVALLLAIAVPAAATPPTAAIPSAEDFGALPTMVDPAISPGGTRLVARTQADGKPRLMIVEVAAGTQSLVALPDGVDLDWYRFAGDGTLLIGVSTSISFFGLPLKLPRVFVFDIAGRTSRALATGGKGFLTDVVHVDPAGRFVLVAAQRKFGGYPAVYRVELATNQAVEIVPPHDGVWRWHADAAGVVRTGIGVDDKKWWIGYRADAAAPFTRTGRHPQADQEQIDSLVFTAGSSQGFAVATGESGRFGLYRYDLAAGRVGALVYENAVADVTDVDLDEAGAPASVGFTDDRARVLWFDPALKAVQAKLDRALPGLNVRITSTSTDRMLMTVRATAADNPGAYYLYDRRAGRLGLIAAPYERLAGKRLATMEPVTYPARDGLPIPGYLTLPPGREARGLPLVVLPHGGPFARDEWGFNVWAQFLASRGYAVLQPNYRGSTGYGRRFVERGYGQWGRGMQDDIDDGVRWLAERGTADAKRVCIMGASFGGYAAEWGAVRNPDLYRCAISYAGVSDIKAQLAYDRKSFAAPRYFRDWRDRVQGTDAVALDALSPAKRAAELTVPLLIAHGDRDTNVPPDQSARLVKALTRAGRAPEYHVYAGEGHGFATPANQVDFLRRVEAFLAKHNPA